ncbi:MAG TPA: hypothetical protein PLV92_02755, partial [Pirellulaceae bacterium]|nr:hypothetical protein [Pirellulaceae bacterium]
MAASAPHDSRYDLFPIGDGNGAAPAGATSPVLPPPSPMPSTPSLADGGSTSRAAGEIWLQGDTLLCACPDCRAPMSVRIWLMLADCWQCG